MHWGHKIIIVFVLFAAGMLTLVTKSIRTKIDMVTPDYYAEELKYQQVIDGQDNVVQLSAPVKVVQSNQDLEITFPEELHGRALTGQVLFYRPSDSGKDFVLPLQLNEHGQLLVSRERFIKGGYRVKMRWEMSGKPYFQEEYINIQ